MSPDRAPTPARRGGLVVLTAVGALLLGAATGAGVTWWIVAALVLLVAGFLLVHAARGHRTAQ